eukprot:scaffold7339_cov249-Pinguiococcus_pyrenoidosus.AAC.26
MSFRARVFPLASKAGMSTVHTTTQIKIETAVKTSNMTQTAFFNVPGTAARRTPQRPKDEHPIAGDKDGPCRSLCTFAAHQVQKSRSCCKAEENALHKPAPANPAPPHGKH